MLRLAVIADLRQPVLGVLPGPVAAAQIELDEVRVGAAGEQVDAAGDEALGERVRVAADLGRVGAERLGGGDAEAGGLRGDRVQERPALEPGEDGPVDRPRVLLAAEDEAAAGTGERLVGRRGDEVAVRDGLGWTPAATSPAKWAMSQRSSAPTSSAISRKRSASITRG